MEEVTDHHMAAAIHHHLFIEHHTVTTTTMEEAIPIDILTDHMVEVLTHHTQEVIILHTQEAIIHRMEEVTDLLIEAATRHHLPIEPLTATTLTTEEGILTDIRINLHTVEVIIHHTQEAITHHMEEATDPLTMAATHHPMLIEPPTATTDTTEELILTDILIDHHTIKVTLHLTTDIPTVAATIHLTITHIEATVTDHHIDLHMVHPTEEDSIQVKSSTELTPKRHTTLQLPKETETLTSEHSHEEEVELIKVESLKE